VTPRTIVVTGANRGIGLEVARHLAARGDTVVLGTRDLDAGQRAAAPLVAAGSDVRARRLEVTDQASIDAVAAELASGAAAGGPGRLDVLVNNAAIHYDTWQNAARADLGVVAEALETNLLGAWRCANAFLPLLRASRHGRIVNVSSESGSLTSMGGGIPAYRVSKAGLNALTRMLAAELRSDGVLVNSVCPGWVATDMGGPGGRPVAEGAASVVWAVDLPDDGPTGGFFRDGRALPW
jgi:NAD(P)-dependent dehydrogenase (short-subunit alcohol dehydrogenase family)